jgi:hypothetical protein
MIRGGILIRESLSIMKEIAARRRRRRSSSSR